MCSLGRILVLRGRLQSLGNLEDGHGRRDMRDRLLQSEAWLLIQEHQPATHLGHLPGPFLGAS